MVKIEYFKASNCDPDGITYIVFAPGDMIEDFETCLTVSKSLIG